MWLQFTNEGKRSDRPKTFSVMNTNRNRPNPVKGITISLFKMK